MDKNITIQKRIITCCLIVFAIILSYWFFGNTGWQADAEWHIILEIIASFLAFFTGGMILMRYYNNKNSRRLLLGCGFLVAASMGIFNAIVTSPFFSYLFPTDISDLSYWSEYILNLSLALFFFTGEMISVYERKFKIDNSVNERVVFALAVLIIVTFIDFFAFFTLPKQEPINLFDHLQRFLPAFLLTGSLSSCLYAEKWKNIDLEYWIVLSMIVNLGPNIYHAVHFDPSNAVVILSHILRIASYGFMLVGLFITIYSIFKKDRTNEKRIRYILDNMKDGIVTINESCVIESCNPAISSIFGYSADEIVGKTFDILIPHYHDGCPRLFLGRRCHIGKSIINGDDISGKRKNGDIFPLEVDITQINFEGKEVFVITLRDITQRREVERLKNEFISVVSHELRTPLTSIRGSLGLLTGNAVDLVADKSKGLIDIAYKNSIRLINLINDILDIEKIEAGKMDFNESTYDIMPIIHQSVSLNESYGHQFNVNFEIIQEVSDAKVKVDKDKLMQVITNLLSNASKFSASGSTVKIAVSRVNNNIRVSVTDQGPGIPPEFQDKIFQKFVQADSSNTRQKGGTGLGLSICKAIIDKMGGTINFDSEVDAGTTFYFDLPEFIENKPVISQCKGVSSKASVLICEDDKDVASLISLLLKQNGYCSDIAYSVEQAKQLLNQYNYDLMTLDLLLPDQDGIAFIKDLNKSSETRNLPIIVISVKADEYNNKLDDNLAVIDWLSKPIDQEKLLEALNRVTSDKTAKPAILHIEDDPDVLTVMESVLKNIADISSANNINSARELIENNSFDIVILDLELPDGNGLELLPVINSNKNIATIIFSAHKVCKNIAQQVDAVLLKSETSNQKLLNTVKSFIKPKCVRNQI